MTANDEPDRSGRPTPTTIGFAVAALAILWIGLGPQFAEWAGAIFDDAYIYLRYAQNVLGGCALEWNCGAGRVEGFTSPLYLALLVLLGGPLQLDLETATTVLGYATWGIALSWFVLLPIQLRKELSGLPVGILSLAIAAALATDQFIAINAMSGMEGGLVCLALCIVTREAFRPRRLAIWAPAMVVVRPELGLATLLQPLLGRDWIDEHLRRAAIAAAVIFTAVTIVRFVVFTDVFPNTFWAKSGGTSDHLAHGLEYLLTSYTRFPLAALALLGFFSARRALRYSAAIVVSWSVYFLWSGGDFYSYARLFVFLVPMAYFVGFTALLELLSRATDRRAITHTVLAAIVVAGVFLGGKFRNTYAPGGFINVSNWIAAGKYFHQCFPDASIAAVPIGAIAYFSQAPVFDLVGITDPKIAIDGNRARGKDFVVGHERYAPKWSLALQPDIVFLDVSQLPGDDRQIKLDYLAEKALIDQIRNTGAPYVVISPRVTPEHQQLLFIRKAALQQAAQTSPPTCFQ